MTLVIEVVLYVSVAALLLTLIGMFREQLVSDPIDEVLLVVVATGWPVSLPILALLALGFFLMGVGEGIAKCFRGKKP